MYGKVISSWSFWFSWLSNLVYFWLLEDIANATMCHSVAFICSNDAKKKVRIYLSTWNLVEIIVQKESNGLGHRFRFSPGSMWKYIFGSFFCLDRNNKIRESRKPKWPRTDVTESCDFVMYINFKNFRHLFLCEILSQIFEISTL